MNAQTTTSTELNDGLQELFGAAAHTTPLAEGQHMGVRVHGVDLTQPYPPPKPNCLSGCLIITAS